MPPTLEHLYAIHPRRTKLDTLILDAIKGSALHVISSITGGSLSSSDNNPHLINAAFVQCGSHWLRVNPSTGTEHLDARLGFRDTGTEGTFHMRFEGLVCMNEEISIVMEWSGDARNMWSKEYDSFVTPVF